MTTAGDPLTTGISVIETADCPWLAARARKCLTLGDQARDERCVGAVGEAFRGAWQRVGVCVYEVSLRTGFVHV